MVPMPNVFLHVGSREGLDRTAASVFGALGASGAEARPSALYPCGTYRQARVGPVVVKVFGEDERGYGGWQFVVALRFRQPGKGEVEAFSEQAVRRLLEAGFGVCRSLSAEESAHRAVRLVYCLGVAGALEARREEVAVL